MTTRDRLIGMGLAAAVILLAVWFLMVSPEKKQISKLNEEVATAHQSLSAAQQKLAGARTAEARYTTAYASIVRMGEAVPTTAQVPALVYDLDQFSSAKRINFNSISSSSSGSSSNSSPASSSSSGGFKQLPFTLGFTGHFFDLYNLFNELTGLATQNENGEVQISGRLLTIQGVSLTVDNEASASASASSASASKKSREPKLTGTVTATAYSLPSSQSLTAGATPTGPAGAGTTPQPASSSGQASPSTPAVVKVTP